MTSTEPPVRPNPYISQGGGWTLSVRVPGHGTWRHDAGQVSQHYAVYNQAGREYHVTIDSAYIASPENPTPGRNLNAHVTSNASIGGRVLHWPDPGFLSVVQQNWMDEQNGAGQFDALLAAFQDRIRLCATNVQLSRNYDRALDEYQRQRHEAAAARRQAKAEYAEELKEWVDALPPEEYQQGFTEKGEWYFLDPDRGVVARLAPRPILIRQGDGLHQGFVSLCESIVAPGASLTAEHWSRLTARLALVRIGDRHYAMRRSEFNACPPATELLTVDQVVELAVAAWTRAAQTSEPYTKVASDKTLMNVNGPDRVEFHLETRHLLDLVGLTTHGSDHAVKLAAELDALPDLPDVYPTTCVAQLQAKLPRIARITRQSQSDCYLPHDQLVSGWSADLTKANSVDAGELAKGLVAKGAGRQVFVADLLVRDEYGSAVYLRDGKRGSARYVGRTEDALPTARLSRNGVTNLAAQAESLRAYFGGGLPKTVVARESTGVVVICDYNRTPLTPLIFVDERKLEEFDLDAAAKRFAERQREIQEAEKLEMAKTEAAISEAVDEYAAAWALIEPQLGSREATLLLYGAEGRVVVATPGSDAALAAKLSGAEPLGQVSIQKTDKPSNKGKIRRLQISFTNQGLRGWIEQLAGYVKRTNPGLPTGFRGYVVTLAK